MLAVDVGRDVVHRARAVERHHGDDVLEAVGLQPLQALAHARAFELEHARRIGLGQQLVALRVIERQRLQVDLDAAPALDELQRFLQHGQRLQAEEVELDEARRLDQLPVVLRDRKVGLRIAIERHQLIERPIADHHAGRVRRGVPVEALQLLRDLQQPRHHRLRVARFLQLGLAVDGLAQRDRVGRIVRHQLAELVHLAVGHLQHAADVAQHRARLQLAVRDDLRDAIVAVLSLHVADHLVAPVLAEIDVEVRHRDALGIEKALEQQAEAQRIEIGDRQRPGDERAGARAAARPDRDAIALGPLDEVGHDQEVAGKLHLGDDVDLVGEALVVVLPREAWRQDAAAQSCLEARFRLPPQLRRLRCELILLAGSLARGHEPRQDRLAAPRPVGAALGDLDGVVQGLRQVGEQLRHLVGGLEVVLARQPAPLVLDDIGALGDADQRIVRLVVVGGGEIDLVGRDDRDAELVGKLEKLRLDLSLVRRPVTLDFDVERAVEGLVQVLQPRTRELWLAITQRAVDRPARSARERDQSPAMLLQMIDLDVRRLVLSRLEVARARQLEQAGVALLVVSEKSHGAHRAARCLIAYLGAHRLG